MGSSGPGWRRRLCAVVGVPAVVDPSAAFGIAAAVVSRFAAVALGGGVEPWSTLLTDAADRSWRRRRWRMSARDVRRRESRCPTHRRLVGRWEAGLLSIRRWEKAVGSVGPS